MSSKLINIAKLSKKLGDEVEDTEDKIENSSKRNETALERIQKKATKVLAVFGGFKVLKGMAELGMDLETTRLKFETLTGSVEAGNKMLNQLDQFANATPFDNADLRSNAELLLNFGTAGSKVLPILKMIGDVSGGNKEKLNSLTLAYAQVSSTGKLMGQDLLQMINAGFNPLQVISEKTGRSMAALKDDMSKGKIGADMVEEAFRIATSQGGRFYGMMDKISQSASGKLSTLLGTFRSKIATWSETHLTPILGKIFDFGTKFINGFGVVADAVKKLIQPLEPLWQAVTKLIGLVFGFNQETFTAASALTMLTDVVNFIAVPIEILANGLTTLVRWLQPIAPVIKIIAIAYGIWTAAQWALNVAMTANPIGLIITAVAVLIGLVVTAYEKVGWFRGSILAVWESITGFAGALKDLVINRIKEMIMGITGIGKTLYLFFTGEWKQAWETGKEAMSNLTGFNGNSAKQFVNDMKGVGKDAGEAYQKGVAEAEANKSKKGILDSIKNSNLANMNTQASITGAGGTDPNADLSGALGKGIEGITGGGQKQTNITVSFDKLVENFTIQSQTIEKGMDESLDALKSMLLRVLNSANQMQTN